MLYEALSQPFIFFCMTITGFLSGFVFDCKDIIFFYCKKNKILHHFLMFFAVFIALFACFAINLKVNYGQFRFFSLFAFSLSFAIQRFLSKNFVAKPILKCYNKFKEKTNERKEKRRKKV